ncbi:hypothetical protein IFVP203_C1120076 [Vibrio parahaemolyticus]
MHRILNYVYFNAFFDVQEMNLICNLLNLFYLLLIFSVIVYALSY